MIDSYSIQPTDVKELQLFMGIFAHEVRTQLTGIISTCWFALEKKADTPFLLRAIASGVEESIQVLDNLLKVIQSNAGEFTIACNKEPFNLKTLLCNTRLSFEAENQLREKRLEIIISPDLETRLIVNDRLIFKQILYNLIINAIKWSYPHTTIVISCLYVNGNVQIEIENTGNTIPPHKLASLFDQFFQLDKGLVGAGLGLYITRLYVQQLKGSISVISEHNKTKFTILIPQPL